MAATSITLQLQYHFQIQNKHSLDAFIRNDNEKDLLLMLREVISILELDVKIESEALREGSLRNLWKLIGDNQKQLTLLGAVAMFLLITVPISYQYHENLSLDNELKREQLRKIKQELVSADSAQINKIVETVVQELQHDVKLQVHKSHFYQRLTHKQEISQISTVQLSEDQKPIGDEKFIQRTEFPKHILKTNKLPPIVDEEAIIEIVAPVLTASDFGWKGIYHDEPIPFRMMDETFKGAVLAKQYTFANGDSIKCVLQLKRELDEVGAIKVVERNVLVVIIKIDKTEPSVVTPQGQRHLRNKKAKDSQLNLFKDR